MSLDLWWPPVNRKQARHGPFPRDRLDVIELEPRALLTAPAAIAHERAPPSVALPHRALHRRRDVAGRRAGARIAGAIGRGELLLPEFARNEDLSRRIRMARQSVGLLKQIVGFSV